MMFMFSVGEKEDQTMTGDKAILDPSSNSHCQNASMNVNGKLHFSLVTEKADDRNVSRMRKVLPVGKARQPHLLRDDRSPEIQ